ncbi:transmembrane protein 116 [Hyperolius riggenbachi]|uniref:transmembrane protein 116 n=1 Tax=Hyperolius riggenbachi TaxID=752182 RepID=UPI0035A36F50
MKILHQSALIDCSMRLEYYMPSNTTIAEDLHGVFIGVRWIQVITAILSIVGSCLIIGYAVFQNVVKSPEVRPLFYLSVSDLFLALCWLIGAILHTKSCPHSLSCYSLQAMGQMFYISTFLYTLNYTWQTSNSLKRRLKPELHQISHTQCQIGRLATVLSSVLPVLFTIPVLSIGNAKKCYENSTHSCLVLNVGSEITTDPSRSFSGVCTGLHIYRTVILLATFCLTAIPILVIMGHSKSFLQNHLRTSGLLQDQQWALIKLTSWSLTIFPLIFFCCSLPAVILTVLKLSGNKGTSNFYRCFYYIQAFTAVSQGFINCLAYGWTQQMLNRLKQRGWRDVDTQTPLLRSQKKQYASTQVSTCNLWPQGASAL